MPQARYGKAEGTVFETLTKRGREDGFMDAGESGDEGTRHLPGSSEKIAVMRLRVSLGYSPWHHKDRLVYKEEDDK